MSPLRKPMVRIISLVGLAWILIAAPAGLAAPPRQDDNTLHYGEPVRGEISGAGQDALWTFDGQAGDVVVVDLQAADVQSLDPFLTLVGPQGEQLALDDDGGAGLNARIGPIELPRGGTYTVVTSNYQGGGSYRLEVVNVAALPAIARDKPLVGEVNIDHPTDFFLLETGPEAAPHLVRLQVGVTGDGDGVEVAPPALSFYAPDGTRLSTDFLGGASPDSANSLDPIALQTDTRYLIAVDWSRASRTTAYALTLKASQTALLAPGVTQRREFEGDQRVLRHYFDAQAGDIITLHLSKTGGTIVPALRVLTNDLAHALFASEGSVTIATSVTLVIPATGVYVVEVGVGTPDNTTGSYTIRATWDGSAPR